MAQRTAQKFTPVNGRRFRVTRLDSCGRIVYGDNSVITSGGFASVKASPNTVSTDAVQVKNANGDLLLNLPESSSFANFGIEIELLEVDPELLFLLTGQDITYDYSGNPIGFDINSKVVASNTAFALEVWTGAPTGACVTGSSGSYGYAVWPFCAGGTIGDIEIGSGAVSFTVTGAVTKDGNSWGTGPYNVVLNGSGVAAKMATSMDATDHVRVIKTGASVPDAVNGSRPQLDPSATAVTAITKTNTGRVYTYGATPAVAAGVGTYWDFGDGTWDYVTTAGSAVTKTYTAAGTYTVSANTNGTATTTSVTVV